MDQDSKPKFYKTKAFEALNAKWYDKLKKSGFEDAESDEDHLTDWSRTLFLKRPEYDQSKEEYYRLAGQFLHDHTFRTETERKIWELHQDGVSIRKIVKLLRKKRLKVSHVGVFNTIKSLASVMVQQWKISQNQS
jgi:hypothetical protein